MEKSEMILNRLLEVVNEMNTVMFIYYGKSGYTGLIDVTTKQPIKNEKARLDKTSKKYHYLDIGMSGAFLIDKETGEIYNIKGYGKPDKNKKKKANLGNILDMHIT